MSRSVPPLALSDRWEPPLSTSGTETATRVGVIGTGFAGRAHIEALRRIPGPRVVAIAASSDDKARHQAERLGVESSYGDYRQMLEQADLHSVHNCTPNHLHLGVNLDVLRAGFHLLSEKPLALDSDETGRLVEASEAAGVVAGVCFNYRHFPLVRQAREELASGRHGRPHLVHGAYLQDWLLKADDWNWRLDSKRAGTSRAVADIGSHWLDNVEYVTGDRVRAVSAELFRLHDERVQPAGEGETFRRGRGEGRLAPVDTEDGAVVSLRFTSGARGALTVSQVSAGRKNRLYWEIDTTSGSLAWDQEEPNRLWVGSRDGPNADLPRDPTLLDEGAAALAHFPGGHQEGWPDGLKNLMIDFYAAVQRARSGETGERSFATFADAHHVTLVVEAIMRSGRSGAWEEVEDRVDRG